jgi:osmotically-inducible protein OsmY
MKTLKYNLALAIAIISISLMGINAQNISGVKQTKVRTTEQRINSALLSLPRYGIFDSIKFQVNGDTVTLTGKVYSLGTVGEAAAAVKDIPCVRNVINNITELPPSPMDDAIRRQTLRTFEQNGMGGYFWETRPDVRIIVEHGRLTLEGYVMNSGDFNRLNIYANSVNGVFNVQNNLVIGEDRNR